MSEGGEGEGRGARLHYPNGKQEMMQKFPQNLVVKENEFFFGRVFVPCYCCCF